MSSLSALTQIAKNQVLPAVVYQYRMDLQGATPVYKQICTEVPQEQIFAQSRLGYKTVDFAGLGNLREVFPGQEPESDQLAEGYPVHMKLREFARKVSVDMRELDQLDARRLGQQMLGQTAGWGRTAIRTKEGLVADIINNGALTAGHLKTFHNGWKGETDPYPKFIYDGKPLFASDHPLKVASSTTLSNTAGATTFSQSALTNAITTMKVTNAKDERNEIVSINPDTLLINPTLEPLARRVVGSAQLQGTSLNDMNHLQGAMNVISWNYLTDTNGWTVMDSRLGGLICYDGGAPQIRVVEDPLKREVHFVCYIEFGVAVKNWRAFYGGNHSTS